MTGLRTLIVALGITLWLPLAAQSAEEAVPSAEKSDQAAEDPAQSAEASAAPKCLQAVVNPVTGFAICVNPKGAPVEPPPTAAFERPCKSRAHDDDPWTVYEHASGCGD